MSRQLQPAGATTPHRAFACARRRRARSTQEHRADARTESLPRTSKRPSAPYRAAAMLGTPPEFESSCIRPSPHDLDSEACATKGPRMSPSAERSGKRCLNQRASPYGRCRPLLKKGIKCELNHIPCHCKAHSPNTPTPTKADKRGMRIRQTVRNAPSRQRCAIEAFVNHTPDTLARQPSRNALQTSATRQPYAYNPPRQRRGALAEGGGPLNDARKHSTQKGTSKNG